MIKKLSVFTLVLLLCFSFTAVFFEVPTVKADVTLTATIRSSSSDGNIFSYSTNYDTAHDSATGTVGGGSYWTVGQDSDSGYYYIYRSFLFFDTSAIPDVATIDNATLSLYVYEDHSDSDFNVTIQNGQPTYPHDPLQSGDYYYNSYSGNGGNRSTSEISGVGYWNITLSETGEGWISDTATTKLALLSSEDIGDSAPLGNEYVYFYSREQGLNYVAVLYVTYTIATGDYYSYTFYGPFDEETGLALDENVTVAVYLLEDQPYETFEFNGTETYLAFYLVQYFRFTFQDNSTREYWVDPSESATATIYIFWGSTTTYTINFLDTSGVLSTYPYVTARRYVNGTLRIIEKRQVDEYNSVLMNLIQTRTYQIYLGNEQTTYVFGDFVATAQTAVQLVLRGVDFPKDTLIIQDHVRIYAYRDFSANTITLIYNDTLEETVSVNIFIFYSNESNAYAGSVSAHSFSFEWASAQDSMDYRVAAYINHSSYGMLPYTQYLTADIRVATPPFDLSFLGVWPFDSSFLIPAFIILGVAACFSALNAYVGAILTCIVAIILTMMGWIPIPIGGLVAAFLLAVLMALIYQKRKPST